MGKERDATTKGANSANEDWEYLSGKQETAGKQEKRATTDDTDFSIWK